MKKLCKKCDVIKHASENTVPIRRNNQEITVKIKGELYREEVAGGRFRRLDIHKNGQPVL
ncbi:MAG: hypothetical protein V8R22_09435 [Lachnospiraceae bacterium]